MKRFVSLAFAALSLASSLTLISATSASAHDEIISTTPAADSQVAPGSVKLAVAFNEAIMDAGDGAGLAIEVTGPDGGILETQCLSVSEATLSAGLDASATGDYTVNWRAVSSDGHPNSGTFAFTVAEGAEAAEAPAADANCLGTMADAKPMLLGAEEPEPITAINETSDNEGGEADDTKQSLDPLAGLGIGLGLFVGLSLIGIAVFELQKRARARAAQAKKDIEEQ
ncbi:MAG: hypothetical protein RLZ28_250 [Actinomycetota bacterium]|jgi:methionine-rich copper-binding protein CopC